MFSFSLDTVTDTMIKNFGSKNTYRFFPQDIFVLSYIKLRLAACSEEVLWCLQDDLPSAGAIFRVGLLDKTLHIHRLPRRADSSPIHKSIQKRTPTNLSLIFLPVYIFLPFPFSATFKAVLIGVFITSDQV